MNSNLIAKLLTAVLKLKGQAEITVMGISMNPTLFEGDKVIIEKCDKYKIGDIIVFDYKNEGILIHRLLKFDGRYFCKGDNAFRLEDIEYNQILGKAVLVNNTSIQPWDAYFAVLHITPPIYLAKSILFAKTFHIYILPK